MEQKKKKQETKHPEEHDYKKKEKTVNLMYQNTAFSAIKEGIYSQFIVPFALALNAASDQIAMISTMPLLMGSFFQLFASDLMNIVKKRKKVIFFTSLIDALMWLPIILVPFLGSNSYFLLLNFLVIQAISSALLNPFYNSLLGDVMPEGKRGYIISNINRISGIFSFASSLIAGVILAILAPYNPFLGFTIIFFVAFLARLISALTKSRFYEPPIESTQKGESLFHFSLNIRKNNFGQFVMYASWMKFAVGVAGPFFAVYMLTYLKMDFITYSLINGGAIISSFLVLHKWGKNIDKNGSKWMLGITGFLVPIVPVLWIIFDRPLILFIIELFSGAVWAGYNLSTSNFIMDATKRENRLIMISYHNFFVGVATFIGAFIGGMLFKYLPVDFMGNIFYFVFGVSAALRLGFSLYFMRKIKEERFVDVEIRGPQSKRVISISPKQGAIFDFIPRKRK